MKRAALALLLAAAALYVLATALQARHPAWGYVAAFAGAALVGAMADWFAVVALFRHPMGLPIAHTAIVPASKDRIGRQLAQFIATHFLATDWVLARLRGVDAAAGLAQWLAQPANAARVADHGTALARWAVAALDEPAVHEAVTELARGGLRQIDAARLSGQLLQALVQDGRHEALLDALVSQGARLLGEDAVQDGISDAIAREVKALKLLGLDQVAARLATRKVIVILARTLLEMTEDPAHPLRQRFDALAADWAQRLQQDPTWQQRVAQGRDELLASPVLGLHVRQAWGDLLAWLDRDLRAPASWTHQRIAAGAQNLGAHLATHDALRAWINAELQAAAPRLLERHRGDIAAFIEARVQAWDVRQMSDELERHLGQDLQFIRINGTVVGGAVGLLIHALTQWWR